MARHAFATLVASTEYAIDALALERSLRAVGERAPLLVLVVGDPLGVERLGEEGCELIRVPDLPLTSEFRARHGRTALHAAAPFARGVKPGFHDPLHNFGKLWLWQLEEWGRIAFIDADAIAVAPVSGIFEHQPFCAAPNLYASLDDLESMNSGVFVAEPARHTFAAMMDALAEPGLFLRRTDQTFLESFFPDWRGLPRAYNTLQYLYLNLPHLWIPEEIKILHYQYEKPWDSSNGKADVLAPLIDLWWSVHRGDGVPPVPPVPPARP